MSATNNTRKDIEPSNPLDVLPESEPLLTKAKPTSKAGVAGWNEPENLITPEDAKHRLRTGKNYGFAAGRGTDQWRLVVFDVEKRGVLPNKAQALIDEHAVLTWDSVHEGRNRLVKVSPKAYEKLDSLTTAYAHLSEGSGDDIEIQTTGHAIGPRCEIDHAECKNTKQGCPGSGLSEYELIASRQYAQIVTKEVVYNLLNKLGIDPEDEPGIKSQSLSAGVVQSPEGVGKNIDIMEGYMTELQNRNSYFFNDIFQRLNGKVGEKRGLTLAGGYIDRSAVEFVTLSDLYGIAKVIGGEDEATAKQLAYCYHDHCCRQAPKTVNSRSRKWLELNQEYRQGMIEAAVRYFDRGKFYRWLHSCEEEQTPGLSRKDGLYSVTTRSCVEFAVQILSFGEFSRFTLECFAEDWELELPDGTEAEIYDIRSGGSGIGTTTEREYPTRQEIVQLAKFVDNDHNKKSAYQKALGNLKKEGRLVLAFCPSYNNSERYVYSQYHGDVIDNARWVESDGKRIQQ